MKIAIDVDALYRRAFGRLDDVSRLFEELRQLRASRSNGGSRMDAPGPDDDPGPDDEDSDDDEVTARCLPVEPD